MLTSEQTGGIPVSKILDRLYRVNSLVISIDDIAEMVGRGAGETEQEHESLILLFLCSDEYERVCQENKN